MKRKNYAYIIKKKTKKEGWLVIPMPIVSTGFYIFLEFLEKWMIIIMFYFDEIFTDG